MREHGDALAREAHEETGLGRYEDKILKNQLVTEKTPGTEDLQPHAVTGDDGLKLTEPAPYGVIAAITPTTNPTSTIINNTIAMLAAGNAVVFNVHPNAKRVSCHNVALINKAIVAAGGPQQPRHLHRQPDRRERAGVDEASRHPPRRGDRRRRRGARRRCPAASAPSAPGPATRPSWWMKPPTLTRPARDIVFGASFDNNIICADEKECLVVSSVADKLIKAMTYNGAVLVIARSSCRRWRRSSSRRPTARARKPRLTARSSARTPASSCRKPASAATTRVRLGIVEVDHDHPLLWTEQMMPILPDHARARRRRGH